MISLFIDEIKNIAGYGTTQYLFDFSNARFDPYESGPNTILCFKSLEEMIPFFQEKFPCCVVRIHEEWIHSTPTTRSLKRGILIDWSA
jgi:hypothetical protein